MTSGCPSLLHAASPSSQPEFCLSGYLSSECSLTFCCHQSPKPLLVGEEGVEGIIRTWNLALNQRMYLEGEG